MLPRCGIGIIKRKVSKMIIDTKVLKKAMAVKLMKQFEDAKQNRSGAEELENLDKRIAGTFNRDETYISLVEDLFKQYKDAYNFVIQQKKLGRRKIYLNLFKA
jgi:hypothetical protein